MPLKTGQRRAGGNRPGMKFMILDEEGVLFLVSERRICSFRGLASDVWSTALREKRERL